MIRLTIIGSPSSFISNILTLTLVYINQPATQKRLPLHSVLNFSLLNKVNHNTSSLCVHICSTVFLFLPLPLPLSHQPFHAPPTYTVSAPIKQKPSPLLHPATISPDSNQKFLSLLFFYPDSSGPSIRYLSPSTSSFR